MKPLHFRGDKSPKRIVKTIHGAPFLNQVPVSGLSVILRGLTDINSSSSHSSQDRSGSNSSDTVRSSGDGHSDSKQDD